MADIKAEKMHAAWRLPEKEKYWKKGWTKAIRWLDGGFQGQ